MTGCVRKILGKVLGLLAHIFKKVLPSIIGDWGKVTQYPPFLFNVVVQSLNIMLERARNLGMVKGTYVGTKGAVVPHLQFADDTIIFCNNDQQEILTIQRILRCFQMLSVLKINISKSL